MVKFSTLILYADEDSERGPGFVPQCWCWSSRHS